MRAFTIEDTIIAYFDGRLNDSESAELLHRVSVSPEIRERFQEHEMLRNIAIRAARNVAVPPHLEEAVFSRITALQQDEAKDRIPVGFWSVKRMSVAAAAVALLLTGTLGSMEFGSTSVQKAPSAARSTVAGPGPMVAKADVPSPANMSTMNVLAAGSANAVSAITGEHRVHAIDRVVRESALPVLKRESATPAESGLAEGNSSSLPEPIAMTPDARPSEMAQVHTPDATNLTLASLRDVTAVDERPLFEFGIETSTQFSIPATDVSPLPGRDFRLHAGYNLDAHDQIGLRLRRGSFERLDVSAIPTTSYFTEVTGSVHAAWMNSEEIYYERSQPMADGRFWIVGGVGFGFYDAGRLLSADIGVRIPVSEHLLAGFGLALSRLSQYGSTNDVLSGHTEPVLYDGSSSRHTINGRLEYGLSYRF